MSRGASGAVTRPGRWGPWPPGAERGGCEARQRSARWPPNGAGWLRRTQGVACHDDRECGTGPPALPRPAGLLAPLARRRRCGHARPVAARRWRALGTLQTLGPGTDWGRPRVHGRPQGRFPRGRPRGLGVPVVGLPLALHGGLRRAHDGVGEKGVVPLLGTGARSEVARKGSCPRCKSPKYKKNHIPSDFVVEHFWGVTE